MPSTLVGLVDQAIQPNDVVSWHVNKIGGLPIWLNEPSADGKLRCDRCGKGLSLVTQLYCPLATSAYHRCLYVFVCCDPGCPSHCQFSVFRCLKFDPSYDKSSAVKDSSQGTHLPLNPDMWAEDQDDWGDEHEDDWDDENQDDERSEWADEVFDGRQGKDKNNPYSENTNFCDATMRRLDVHNAESNAETCSSSSLISAGNALNDDHKSCTQSDRSSAACLSTVHVEMSEAVSQMKISPCEKPHFHPKSIHHHQQHSSNDIPGNSPSRGVSSDPAKREQVFAEDIGPQSDRFEELAMLLNTKFKETVQNPVQVTRHCQGDISRIFEPYYLYVIEEPQTQHDELSLHVVGLIKEYEKSEGKQLHRLMAEGSKTKGKGSGEMYEKTELKHGDRIFHKFLKRLQKCPDQCIRYDRNGEPLLASDLKRATIPPCGHCGAPRIFELQLLPALIPWLVLRGHGNIIEFSTVLLFTCKDNCLPSGLQQELLEEVAICQDDPDQHLYR